jgi:hypothetical protein
MLAGLSRENFAESTRRMRMLFGAVKKEPRLEPQTWLTVDAVATGLLEAGVNSEKILMGKWF